MTRLKEFALKGNTDVLLLVREFVDFRCGVRGIQGDNTHSESCSQGQHRRLIVENRVREF